MLHALLVASEIVGALTAIITFFALLIRPIRRRIFTDKAGGEGLKCLLRDAILRIYHHGQETESLHQYEAQNLEMMYNAYKGLGGNSFIDRIYHEMQEWSVRS
jgi:hypothetical protein